MNDIIKHRNFVIGQIQKSFDDELEKARSGVYADTAEKSQTWASGPRVWAFHSAARDYK